MARRRGKTVDKWKQKVQYKILAPEDYEYRELGTTMSDNPKNLAGRRIKVSMRDVTGDKVRQHQNLIFELAKPEGTSVHTKFKKYSIERKYLTLMVREGGSKIQFVENIDISDSKIIIKIIITTRGHAQAAQKKEIMKKLSLLLNRHKDDSLQNFVHLIITQRLGKEMHRNIKNICPIGRLEICEVSVL